MPNNVPEIVPTIFNEAMVKQVLEKFIFPQNFPKQTLTKKIQSSYHPQTAFL